MLSFTGFSITNVDVEVPANVAAWWLCKQVTLNVHHASEVRYSVKRFPQNVNCLSCAVEHEPTKLKRLVYWKLPWHEFLHEWNATYRMSDFERHFASSALVSSRKQECSILRVSQHGKCQLQRQRFVSKHKQKPKTSWELTVFHGVLGVVAKIHSPQNHCEAPRIERLT